MEQVTHGWLARACEFKFTHIESTVCYRPPPFIDNQIVTGSSNGWPGSESPHHQLVSTMLSGAWDHSRPKHQFYIYGTVTSEGANHAKSLCRTGFQVNPLTQWLTRLGFYWQPIPYLAIGPHGSLGRASAGVSSTWLSTAIEKNIWPKWEGAENNFKSNLKIQIRKWFETPFCLTISLQTPRPQWEMTAPCCTPMYYFESLSFSWFNLCYFVWHSPLCNLCVAGIGFWIHHVNNRLRKLFRSQLFKWPRFFQIECCSSCN